MKLLIFFSFYGCVHLIKNGVLNAQMPRLDGTYSPNAFVAVRNFPRSSAFYRRPCLHFLSRNKFLSSPDHLREQKLLFFCLLPYVHFLMYSSALFTTDGAHGLGIAFRDLFDG